MRRSLVPSVLALLIILATAIPALANGKPDIVPNEPLPPEFYPAGVVCDFDLTVEYLVDSGRTITFPPDDDGAVRQLIVGRLVMRVTNEETGASSTQNVSGPGKFVYDGEVLHITGGGPWLLYAFPGDAGGPGMWLTKGKVSITIDLNTGTWLAVSKPRNIVDLCAALGGASAPVGD